MKHQGVWAAVVHKHVSEDRVSEYGQVACSQSDCGSLISVSHRFSNESRPAWEASFYCRGTESTLRQCRGSSSNRRVHAINTTTSTEVICSGTTEELLCLFLCNIHL